MQFDNDVCDCTTSAFLHPPQHITCCRCVLCSRCESWIRSRRWREHQAKPHEELRRVTAAPPPLREAELVPDSLETAFEEVSGVDLADIDHVFRAAVRSCVGQLIDHLEGLGGPYKADRTTAWEAVLRILLDPDLSHDDKVERFLELFDGRTDDLVAQVTGVVLSAEELFPQLAPRR